MKKAKHHFVIYPVFIWLTSLLIKRHFRKIVIDGQFQDNGKPILVIANHISWWDGFWIMYLNLKILHRKVYFMMLEEQLKKHWYFQFTGGYSVKKKSLNIIESLDYTLELLNNSNNMVFLFPQGEIKSLYNTTIDFEKGIQWIIERSLPDLQVIFMVNLPDYFSDSKPSVFIYIKSYPAGYLKDGATESEFREFYDHALQTQKIKVS
jgi:1-acyl-sn-glycerol-3-phosphate acyltransferase